VALAEKLFYKLMTLISKNYFSMLTVASWCIMATRLWMVSYSKKLTSLSTYNTEKNFVT